MKKNKSALQLLDEQSRALETAVQTLADQGKLTDEIRKEVAELKDEHAKLKRRTVERQLSLPGVEDERQKFSLARAVSAIRMGSWKGAEFEAEVIKQTHELGIKIGHPSDVLKKDVLAGGGSTGGFLLPDQLDPNVVALPIARRPVLNDMGITRIGPLGVGDFHVPTEETRVAAYWIGELQKPTRSGKTFGRRTMRMKKVAGYVACSNDMVRQGAGNISMILERDLVDKLDEALEIALVSGSGSEYQPRGILNTPGVLQYELGTNGKQFGWRDIPGMELMLEEADTLNDARPMGMVTHPRVLHGLRIQGYSAYNGQTSNTPAVIPGFPFLSKKAIEDLTGYKWGTSTLIPKNLKKGSSTDCSLVMFGDWSEVILATWSGLEIAVSNEASDGTNHMFVEDGFFVRAMQTADIMVRQPKAFVVCKDAKVGTITELPA